MAVAVDIDLSAYELGWHDAEDESNGQPTPAQIALHPA